MCRISKILGFLTLSANWDPSLMFVMMSAVVVNFFTFKNILAREKPLNTDGKFGVPARGVIDAKLIGGAAIFGLGWGLSGLCPGPGVICLFTMTHGIIWVASLALGQIAFDIINEKMTAGSSDTAKPLIQKMN